VNTAIKNKKNQALKLILNKILDLNYSNLIDYDGYELPIYIAIAVENNEALQLLIEYGAEFNIRSKSIKLLTPMEYAIMYNNLGAVKVLAKHNAIWNIDNLTKEQHNLIANNSLPITDPFDTYHTYYANIYLTLNNGVSISIMKFLQDKYPQFQREIYRLVKSSYKDLQSYYKNLSRDEQIAATIYAIRSSEEYKELLKNIPKEEQWNESKSEITKTVFFIFLFFILELFIGFILDEVI
jgi:ankyrin repeat protein